MMTASQPDQKFKNLMLKVTETNTALYPVKSENSPTTADDR